MDNDWNTWALHYEDKTVVLTSLMSLDELWEWYGGHGLLDIVPYNPTEPDRDDAHLVRGDHDADL